MEKQLMSMIGLTVNTDQHISSTTQAYQQFLWTKAHIIARIRDRFIAKANDCDDSAETCKFNRDENIARLWREQRDKWLAKADEQLGGWNPSTEQLNRLIELEKRQNYVTSECQSSSDALAEALRLEKPI